jgi:hypothetical protein
MIFGGKMKLPFEFRQVTADCLSATEQHWMSYVDANSENVNRVFYESCFTHSRGHMQDGQSGDSKAALYGVFDDINGVKTAVALVHLVHARPQSQQPWLKMLSVYVEPMLDAANNDPDINKLAWIAATIVVGAFELTFKVMPAKELKIWSNVPMTKEFLTAVSTALFNDHLEFSVHGNWFVVRNREAKTEPLLSVVSSEL